MSEPTLTDEQRETLDQWYTRDHEVPVMADGPLDRLHAVVAAMLADERAAREAAEAEAAGWQETAFEYRRQFMGALLDTEAAEAKVRDLTAGIGALADQYARNGAERLAAGRPAWPNNVARDLRALVDDSAAALAEVRAEAAPVMRCWRSECRNACYYPGVCPERRPEAEGAGR